MNDEKKDVLGQAMDLYKVGKVEEAEALLREVISQMPSGWRPRREDAESIRIAFWNLDEFQMYVAYHKKKTDDMRIILWDSPSYPKACYLLAFIAVEQKKTAEALGWLEKGLSLEPDHPDLLAEKARALQTMGRHVEAVGLYLRATEVRPWATVAQRAPALRGAAVSSIDLGQLDEAEQLLRKSLVLEPNSRLALDELDYIAHLRRGGRQTKLDTNFTTTYGGGEDMLTAALTPYKKGNVIGGKYEVHDVLGKGGFGVVYKVFDRGATSIFALKTFRDEYLKDEKTRKRFRKEASLWIDLERHPFLVQAHFVEEVEGRLYIAMEYIEPDEQGLNTLEGHLRQGTPDLAQSLRWAIQFCHGMEYAYSKGIRCHRDIKPANIMIGDDETVRIADFGLAGVLGASEAVPGIRLSIQGGMVGLSGQTMEGTGFGTPTHMPPEQFTDAASCDERSDIYSFGVVLYQMASGGRLPFLAPNPIDGSEAEKTRFWREMHRLHSHGPVPKLDSPLFPTVQVCMEKSPAKRFQSFCELRGKLESLLKTRCGEDSAPPALKVLDAKEWNDKGVSLDNLGRSDEALRCYDRAIELDPRLTLAWCSKGASLNALGRHEEALGCYDKALELDPEYTGAWLNKGHLLHDLNRDEEALCCFDRAVALDPANGLCWYAKGHCLVCLGSFEEAIRFLDKTLELDPKSAAAWLQKGYSLFNLSRNEEAIVCYTKALEFNPRNVLAWRLKALSEQTLGRNVDAVRSFKSLIACSPPEDQSFAEEARRHVSRLEEHPDLKALRECLDKGSDLAKTGHHDEAIECYNKALELDSRCARAWYDKGSSLTGLGRYEEAIRCYDKALELDPKDAQAWCSKGYGLARLGRGVEAIRCFDGALEFDPQSALAWYYKAICQELLGLKQEAVRSYKQFIALAPTQYTKLLEDAQRRIRELSGR
jgi:tetratricopeptide (TPR) repeat protein